MDVSIKTGIQQCTLRVKRTQQCIYLENLVVTEYKLETVKLHCVRLNKKSRHYE